MKWRKGPPPSIGWWPASAVKFPEAIRWWNGKWWSIASFQNTPLEQVKKRAREMERLGQDRIEWTNRPAWWPNRSKT
jgi:hypothetical protein